MNSLSSLQIEFLLTNQIVALTNSQVSALTTVQVAGLLTNQINSLNSSQWGQVSTSDVLSLTSTQIAGLSSNSLTKELRQSTIISHTYIYVLRGSTEVQIIIAPFPFL